MPIEGKESEGMNLGESIGSVHKGGTSSHLMWLDVGGQGCMGRDGSLRDPECQDENSTWISQYNEQPLE